MTRTSLTVIFSSAGRRVGLIDCFRQAASRLGLDLKVVACDLSPEMSSACQHADLAFKVPRATDEHFIDVMQSIAVDARADLVVPTIDTELSQYAAAVNEFSSFGCRVHVSPPDVIDIVRDKFRTMRVLASADVPVPHTDWFEEVARRPEAHSWPMFMKPSAGSASRLVRRLEKPSELPREIPEPMILQDFLDGPEYTVNAFVDERGILRSVVTHRRIQVRAGEVEKGVTERHAGHAVIARAILRALPGMRGAFCFQIIDDKTSGPMVIEINARFGGGYPLIDHAGATYAQWLLEEVAGMPSTASDQWRDGITMLRYDAAIFVGPRS